MLQMNNSKNTRLYKSMMISKTKILWCLALFLIISIALNILMIDRYNLAEKVVNKIARALDTTPTVQPYSYKDLPNDPIVYHLTHDRAHKIDGISETAKINIPNHLIIESGTYTFIDKNYSLDKEGLYRFVLINGVNEQRIVYKNNIDSLLSAISWIVSHGNSDAQKTNIELSKKALKEKLFITCGTVSIWANSLLDSLNIKSRIVMGMTVDKWNTYDNGHTLIEVWRTDYNKWVLYDLDNNSYFIPTTGSVPLSLIEFSIAVMEGDYRIINLSLDTKLDVSNFTNSNEYNYNFFSEANNINIRDWYRRVMQVPLIYNAEEQKYLFMSAKYKDKIEMYSKQNKYVTKEVFIKKFYPM